MGACRKSTLVLLYDTVNRDFLHGILSWQSDKADKLAKIVSHSFGSKNALDGYGVSVSHWLAVSDCFTTYHENSVR